MQTETFPRKLYVELATHCNLGCAMCVKHSLGWDCADGFMEPATFESLVPFFPRLDTLNLNGVGESLLHPELPDFIALARTQVPESCRIGFQTNGMLLDAPLAERLVQSGLNRICFSVDSPDPRQMSDLRTGSTLDQVGQAFALMARAGSGVGGFEIGAQTVVSPSNVSLLPEMIRWSADHGAGFVLVSHILPYTRDDAARSLHVMVAERNLRLYRSWQQRFQAQGLDLSQFTQAFYAFVRTPAQQRLVDGVLSMLAEAREQGYEFSLPNVLQVDLERMRRVRDIFHVCDQLARDLGVRLELPTMAAREPRRCAFVAEPSLFVACDGAMTPCYFLWHSYTCWPGGEQVRVRQKSFGRAGRDDVLQVWNSPEFAAFRAHARTELFPRCGDCSLTPCDFVQGYPEPFTRDCYDIPVPCGVCPWSGGGFICLQ